MARIIEPAPPAPEPQPRWKKAGDEVVTIALDKNEVVAIVHACGKYRSQTNDYKTEATSLNGAGSRVYEALRATFKQENGWS